MQNNKSRKIIHQTAIWVLTIVITVAITRWFTEPSLNLNQSQALIEKVMQNNVTIVNHFDAYDNLEGFIVKQGNSPDAPIGILYTDKAGRYLISGQIVTENGNNLVQDNYRQYIQPDAAIKAFAAAAKTVWISQGSDKAPHKMYVVADPNCRFCHQLYEQLQPHIDNGDLQVRWILVGFLKPSSQQRALAILAAKNPAKALSLNEQDFNDAQEEGGIAPLAKVSPAAQQKLNTNMSFFSSSQLISTPVIIYKGQNGIVNLVNGLPANGELNTLINSLSNAWQ